MTPCVDQRLLASAVIVALALSACAASQAPEVAAPADAAPTPAEEEALPAADPHLVALEAAALHAVRSEENRARDPFRNPVETLAFFGVRPDATVVEISPGGGWYAEILAPLLHAEGTYIAASFNPEGPEDAYFTQVGRQFVALLASNPVFERVQRTLFAPPDQLDFGPEASADVVLTFRNLHGWQRRGSLDAILAAAHRALKPGGVLGVVQHRAAEGSAWEETIESGYLPEAWVIARIEAAGFRLDARSEINANPRDTRDHPSGVWTLPPTLRLGDQDRERYLEIGESDRMTLRFVKVER